MKLRQICESSSILDRLAVFKVHLWADPDVPKEDLADDFTKLFVSEPPPGITPIPADVVRIDWDSQDENDLIEVYVRMTIEDYIRNSVEYDNDPYSILGEIKRAAGPEAATAAHEFMRTATDLRVARVGMSDGGISGDSWPAQANL